MGGGSETTCNGRGIGADEALPINSANKKTETVGEEHFTHPSLSMALSENRSKSIHPNPSPSFEILEFQGGTP